MSLAQRDGRMSPEEAAGLAQEQLEEDWAYVKTVVMKARPIAEGRWLLHASTRFPGHDISIQWELDTETGKIVRSDAQMAEIPHDDICREVLLKAPNLEGLVIKAGVNFKMQEIIGGAEGCYRWLELAWAATSAARHVINKERNKAQREEWARQGLTWEEQLARNARMFNTCWAHNTDRMRSLGIIPLMPTP